MVEPRELDGDDGEELSLEALSNAYAELIGRGALCPDAGGRAAETSDCVEEPSAAANESDASDWVERRATSEGNADEPLDGEVSPRAILEAMLFVGHPNNEPLTSREVASLMRGVTAEEVDALVQELNASYAAEGCPYRVRSVGAGYLLLVEPEFAPLRDKYFGRVREARLSQAAVDVLAVVAYNQPLTRERVDELRGRPSGAVLAQLVRRQLLRIERSEQRPRVSRYRTTDRFLDLFGLDSLRDLPKSEELAEPT